MTDIVEKLRMRSASLRSLGGIGHEDADTDDEAADEIEQLRGALQEIEHLSRRQADGYLNRKTIHQIAFHVITGEKTDD